VTRASRVARRAPRTATDVCAIHFDETVGASPRARRERGGSHDRARV